MPDCGGKNDSAIDDKSDSFALMAAGRPSVHLTGAYEGEVIEGGRTGDQASQSAGVLLMVVNRPMARRPSGSDEDELARLTARHLGLTPQEAKMRLQDVHGLPLLPEVAPPMRRRLQYVVGKYCLCHKPLTCKCPQELNFKILDVGKWKEFEGAEGTDIPFLEEAAREGTWLSWMQILERLGNRFLSLRHELFTVRPSSFLVDHPYPNRRPMFDGYLEIATRWLIPAGSDKALKVPPSAALPPLVADVQRLVAAVYDQACPAADDQDKVRTQQEHCSQAVALLTMGQLKSLFQKLIRGGVRTILVEGVGVPTQLYLLCAVGQLFLCKGVFVPEVQSFVRGSTAVLKRLAVVLAEDAFVSDGCTEKISFLLSVALATKLLPDYHVTADTMQLCMTIAMDAMASWECLDLTTIAGGVTLLPRHLQTADLRLDAGADFECITWLLKELRSLAGDLEMYDNIASTVKVKKRLPLLQIRPEYRESIHRGARTDFSTADFHCYRGIALLMPPSGRSFAEIHRDIFRTLTGINPRRSLPAELQLRAGQPWDLTAAACFKAARLAQYHCFYPPRPLPLLAVKSSCTVRVPMAVSQLAAAAGHITVRCGSTVWQVVLGEQVPEDMMVIRKPSRDAKRDLLDVDTDTENVVLARARAKPHKLTGSLRGCCAQFRDGEWQVDHKSWRNEWVPKGWEEEVPVHPHDHLDGLTEDQQLAIAFTRTGDGIVEEAEYHVGQLCRSLDYRVLGRLLSLMRFAGSKLVLPVPALDGGLAQNALEAPTRFDPACYRALLLLSAWVPGALQPSHVPGFRVKSRVLFARLLEWVTASFTRPHDDGQWQLPDHSARLYDYQKRIVEQLKANLDREHGCFLLADTGLGKTLIAEHTLQQRLSTEKYVLWVCPGKIQEATRQLLCDQWACPAVTVSLKSNRGGSRVLKLKPGCINVIKHDQLRLVTEELLTLAHETVVVFDEVDTCYGSTARTSAAFMLARSCAWFIAMTATAVCRDLEPLIKWLDMSKEYAVTDANYLTAFAGSCAVRAELGIETVDVVNKIPLSSSVRITCKQLVGKWVQMAQVILEATDNALVQTAQAEAFAIDLLSTGQEICRGCLLVADSEMHANRLVNLLTDRGVVAGCFDKADDSSLEVLVVTKRNCRGYNHAIRFGSMVTGVYAGNAADRQQMRGRIKRIGQQRSIVRYVTVVMENTILDLLHQRHEQNDLLNCSLESLGHEVGAEILAQLQ
jgi:hypothetical protein